MFCRLALSLLIGMSSLAAADLIRIGIADPICKQSACSCVGDAATRSYAKVIDVLRAHGFDPQVAYFEETQLLGRQVVAGNIDLMICKSWDGWQYARDAKRTFLRIADVTAPDGGVALRGVFLVRADSPLHTLADLNGRVVGLGNVTGYEKDVLARDTLKRAGIVPSRTVDMGACSELALAVKERTVDGAVVSDYAIDKGCVLVVGTKDDFRIIGTTDRSIPFVTVAVAETVPVEIRQRLAETLLAIKDPSVLAELESAGFKSPLAWEPGLEH